MRRENAPSAGRIGRIRQGDAEALAAAFDEYRPRLRKTAMFRMDPRLLGRVDPDDILQEAYLNAARRCTHVEGNTEQSLFVWLRLVVNQTLVEVRRRHLDAEMRDAGREVALQRQASPGEPAFSPTHYLLANIASPPRALQQIELAEHLRAALGQMDAVDREVLELRHFEELANQEVAEVLGIQQKAASIRYFRALRRLKALLEATGGYDALATSA